MSALKVVVTQDREHVVQFLVRLSSIIAGIIVISGYMNSLLQLLNEYIGTKFFPKSDKGYVSLDNNSEKVPATPQTQNFLISNANQMADVKFEFTMKP